MLRYGPRDAQAVFVNPSNRDRRFQLWLSFGTDSRGPFEMRLSGLVSDAFPLNKPPTIIGPPATRFPDHRFFEFVVPPGRHAIRFQCDPPPHFVAPDYRGHSYFIMLFNLKEVPNN